MGARGPAPTPTAILNMRGSRWPERNRRGEPTPKRGRPRCPRHLNKSQRSVWRAACDILDDMGVLTTADGAQLERYAVLFVRWRRCVAFLEQKDAEHAQHGVVVPPGCYPIWSKDSHTYVQAAKDGTALIGFAPYPTVREAHQIDVALKGIEQQFGLTPAARARITTTPADDVDEFDEFLNPTTPIRGQQAGGAG